jgi:hypothetical protein
MEQRTGGRMRCAAEVSGMRCCFGHGGVFFCRRLREKVRGHFCLLMSMNPPNTFPLVCVSTIGLNEPAFSGPPR